MEDAKQALAKLRRRELLPWLERHAHLYSHRSVLGLTQLKRGDLENGAKTVRACAESLPLDGWQGTERGQLLKLLTDLEGPGGAERVHQQLLDWEMTTRRALKLPLE